MGGKLLASLVSGSAIPVLKHGLSGVVQEGETIIYEQTSTSGGNMYNFESGNVAGGMAIKSGDALIGEEINKVTFSLSKTGTPPQATLYARVFNTASALTVKHTFGSLATSELDGTPTPKAFDGNLGSVYTIASNDSICIYCDNSATSYPDDMVLQAGKSGSTSTLKYADYNTSWSSTGNQLPYLILAKA